MMKKHDKSALMEIFQVLGTLLHVDCQSVFRKNAFYRVVWRDFANSEISEIHYLWPQSFFSKCLKCYVDSGNGVKSSKNIFQMSNNCIWIGT